MSELQSRLEQYYETVPVAAVPGDIDFVEGCRPDLYFSTFGEVDLNQVANLGVRHVLLDVDGTLKAQNDTQYATSKETAQKLVDLSEDTRFETVSLATENCWYPDRLLEALGLVETTTVYQPFDAGPKIGMAHKSTDPFWLKILFELDCLETPEKVVMIGDSMPKDIVASQKHGLKTVLVDRLEKHLSKAGRAFLDSRYDKNKY